MDIMGSKLKWGWCVLVLVGYCSLGTGLWGEDQDDTEHTSPVPIYRAPPYYPFELRRGGITGKVVVEFIVTTKGEAVGAKVVSATHKDFKNAAVSAVKKWKFKPGTVNGKPVNTRMRVPIVFTLDDRSPSIFTLPKDSISIGVRISGIRTAVYPFEALLKKRKADLKGTCLVNEEGRISEILWDKKPSSEFGHAVNALADTIAFTPSSDEDEWKPMKMKMRLRFDPKEGDVRINKDAERIFKRVRKEGMDAPFTPARDLDQKLTMLARVIPVFPTRLDKNISGGETLIEFFVDQNGRVQLPRMISASEEAFGYAACQAIAGWKFKPPLKNGKPVVVRVRVPVIFKR